MAQWDDPKYAELTELLGKLSFLVRDDGEAAPADQIKRLANYWGLPDGEMRNGKIVPSAVGGILTLAVKTRAGTDPSLVNPVYVGVGGTTRLITAALSLTVPAAVNTFNAGGDELKTQEINLFPYVCWKTSASAVVLLASRIPYARLYSDFSGVATNEKYAAFSAAPAATDDVCVIGRFAATLSAGPAYTWTVPPFTAANLVQRPIFETSPLTWTPVWSASGGMTYTGVFLTIARYQFTGRQAKAFARAVGTTGGVASSAIYGTLPFNSEIAAIASETANGSTEGVGGRQYIVPGPPDMMAFQRYDVANLGLGAGKIVNGNFIYWIG